MDENALDQSRFYPAHLRSEWSLGAYWKKLRCYDDEIYVAGDYQSDRAAGLQISIDKCDNSTDEGSVVCKSDEEIQKYLARKFLLTLNNQ